MERFLFIAKEVPNMPAQERPGNKKCGFFEKNSRNLPDSRSVIILDVFAERSVLIF